MLNKQVGMFKLFSLTKERERERGRDFKYLTKSWKVKMNQKFVFVIKKEKCGKSEFCYRRYEKCFVMHCLNDVCGW